jgi:predicted dehydrogenase
MNTTNPSRRDFVRALGAAAIAAPFVGIAGAQEPGKKLGVALVGLGSLSTKQIAPALAKSSKLCKLVAIVTGTPAKADKWMADYGLPKTHVYNYETFDQLATNPDVDIIYVVLPNSMHAEYTIRAAKAGKHVLCEKPMATSAADCQRMIDACKAADRLLAIGYRCQFEPHHRECRRLASEKVFGAVKYVEAGFGFKIGDPAQWRLRKGLAGGGALMDVGIYALQAARFLVGEEPIAISALETKTDPVKFAEVDETIVWTMRFPGGVVAKCSTSYNFNGENRFRAYAEKGWFELDPAYSYAGNSGRRSDKLEIKFDAPDQFATELDDFAQRILEKKPSSVSGEEGLRDLRVIEAIYQSIATGATVKLG